MNEKRKNLIIIFTIAVISILIRLLFIYTLPYDSDEITWSIIGRRVLSGEDFHIFFLNQKYMGAIEGYIVGIFQALFGYNLLTLRINSLIFSTAVSITIYLILKKLTNKKYAILGPIIFNLASFDVTLNYTKAWGNRPLVSLIGLLVVYSCWYLLLSKEKITNTKRFWLSSLTGFFLGLSFWANLENVYFIVIAFAIFVLSGIGECVTFCKNKKGRRKLFNISWTRPSLKQTSKFIISFLFYILLFWLFYMLVTKKSLFNPYETLIIKLGIENNKFRFLDFGFETKFFLLLFYIVAPVKLLIIPAKNRLLRSFSLFFASFMLGAYFTISRNSIERTNQIEENLNEQYVFLTTSILPIFFGTSLKSKLFGTIIFFPLVSLISSLIKVFKRLTKAKIFKINLEDVFCLYYLIPILFFASKAGGINSSSRYITNLWPGFVILFVYGFYILFKHKNILLKMLAIFILIFFIRRNFLIVYPSVYSQFKQEVYANTDPINTANYFLEKEIKGCYAGYWNAYPIMFESDYKVICSPSPNFGYGENETPFNTVIVDSFENPAFVFTTQKRVDEFFRRWACSQAEESCLESKKVKVTEEKMIGKYFIFLTTRIK